jgi:hypothetical protein
VSYFFEGGADGPFESPGGLLPTYVDDFLQVQTAFDSQSVHARSPTVRRRIVDLVNEVAGEGGEKVEP